MNKFLVVVIAVFLSTDAVADIIANTELTYEITGDWSFAGPPPWDHGGYGGADAFINPGAFLDYELVSPWDLPNGITAPGAGVGCPHGSAYGGALNPYASAPEFYPGLGMISQAGWDLGPTADYGSGIGWVMTESYTPDTDGTVSLSVDLSYAIDMIDANPPPTSGAVVVAWVALWEWDWSSGARYLVLDEMGDWTRGNVSPDFYPDDQLVRSFTVDAGASIVELESLQWTIDVDSNTNYMATSGVFVESTYFNAGYLSQYITGAVPEPASMSLLFVGSMILLSRRRTV